MVCGLLFLWSALPFMASVSIAAAAVWWPHCGGVFFWGRGFHCGALKGHCRCQIVNIFVGHVAAQEKILHFSLGIINDVPAKKK